MSANRPTLPAAGAQGVLCGVCKQRMQERTRIEIEGGRKTVWRRLLCRGAKDGHRTETFVLVGEGE